MRIASQLYSSPPSMLMRYGIALATVALVIFASGLFVTARASSLLLAACAAVIVTTSLAGRGPGLFATLCLGLFAAYRLPPDHSWLVESRYQFPLALFIAIGLFVSLLNMRLSLAKEDDLTPGEAWRGQVRAPAEAIAGVTPLKPETRLQQPGEPVLMPRETLYQWSRNSEHIRDLTWYAEECMRTGMLKHARMWVKLAHELASQTGSEMEQHEAHLTDVEGEAPKSQEETAAPSENVNVVRDNVSL